MKGDVIDCRTGIFVVIQLVSIHKPRFLLLPNDQWSEAKPEPIKKSLGLVSNHEQILTVAYVGTDFSYQRQKQTIKG